MATWVVHMVGEPPVRLQIVSGRAFRIGRDTEAELCLDDKLVSRRHCELHVSAGRLELHDLGSRNGTRLNGKPVAGKIELAVGDEIKVGNATLVVDGPQTGAPATGGGKGESGEGESGESDDAAQVPPAPAHGAAGTTRKRLADSGRHKAASSDIRASLAGYDLTGEVARGRTGVIYRARALRYGGREVLVKVLDPTLASSENALARFEAEATALSRIDHPNIVRLIEISAAATRHFYSMEVVEGRTLDEMTRGGAHLAPREAIAIAVQVARGLGVAHATGVVHRDIAPASIMVTPDGVARLFDFAFVKTADEMPSFTNIGDVVGDLRYSSPEQAGNPRAVDHRSDFYALGATLYHVIAGRPPLEGRNYLDTYHKLVSEVPRPLSEIVPEARPKLVQAVVKLLAKEREARFQRANELAQALSEALLEAVIAGRKSAPPAGVVIGAEFQGVELLELLEIMESRRASGVLTIAGEGIEGEIGFRQGEVIHAQAPGASVVISAAARLLDVRSGTFAFRSRPDIPEDSSGPPLKPAELALDALRRRLQAQVTRSADEAEEAVTHGPLS